MFAPSSLWLLSFSFSDYSELSFLTSLELLLLLLSINLTFWTELLFDISKLLSLFSHLGHFGEINLKSIFLIKHLEWNISFLKEINLTLSLLEKSELHDKHFSEYCFLEDMVYKNKNILVRY